MFNTYLRKENGETTEIDLILLHGSGIYIIESKNYNGWIYGNDTQRYWTQTLAGGHEKNRFYNPIFQNDTHTKYLSEYLLNKLPKLSKDIFNSYIVFGDDSELHNIILTNMNHMIINRSEILQEIINNSYSVGNKLDNNTIDEIYTLLYPFTQVSEADKQKHITTIHNKWK